MSNVRIIYQLAAQGESVNGWRFRSNSKATFASKEAANAHISTFEASCYDSKYLDYAVPGSLKTSIVELEFYD